MAGAQATLWPVRPKPLDGEILSSWLARVGQSFGLSLQQFRKLCLPRVPGQCGDVDLVGDVQFYEFLAASGGISVDRAKALGLDSDEGRVFIGASSPDWIVPLRTAGQIGKSSALPFCPSCIAADAIPFYRKPWRYAFHPMCPAHGLLTTACPRCGAPYSYLANDHRVTVIGSGTMHVCRKCETRFSARASQDVGDTALQPVIGIQNELMAAVDAGWIEIDDRGPIPVVLYLHGLRLVASLFTNPDLAPGTIAFLSSQGGPDLPTWNRAQWLGTVESRSALVRAWILLASTWLTRAWPDRFVALADILGVTPARLLGRSRPAWMNSLNVDSLLATRRPPNAQQMGEAKRVLTSLMQWPPTDADVRAFLLTGRVPEIKPLVSKPTRPIGRLIDKAGSSSTPRPREIYSPVESDPSHVFDEDIEEASQDIDGIRHMLRARNRSRRKSGHS